MLAAAAMWSGCVEPGVGNGTIEVRDSAGIRIVINRSLARDTTVLASPAVRIGSSGFDAADPYVLELVSDITVDPAGRVFVVDNRGARVAVFDSAGAWLYDIGREGAGPGEHRGPIRITISADTVLIWDALQRRLNRFTSNGEFIDVTVIGDRVAAVRIVPVGAGYIDEIEWGQHMDPAPARGAIVGRSRDGQVSDTLLGPFPVPDIGWQWTDQTQRVGMMVNPPVFSIRPVWDVREGSLIWSMLETGQIEKRTLPAGSLTSILRTGAVANPTTTADREAHVDAAIERYGIDPARRPAILESTVFAEQRPLFAAMLLDDRGWIWIAEQDPAHAERAHVGSLWHGMDETGVIQRALRFPDSFELRIIDRGRAYGIDRDANGVEVVTIFDIPEFER